MFCPEGFQHLHRSLWLSGLQPIHDSSPAQDSITHDSNLPCLHSDFSHECLSPLPSHRGRNGVEALDLCGPLWRHSLLSPCPLERCVALTSSIVPNNSRTVSLHGAWLIRRWHMGSSGLGSGNGSAGGIPDLHWSLCFQDCNPSMTHFRFRTQSIMTQPFSVCILTSVMSG